jgi:hypothetical protein
LVTIYVDSHVHLQSHGEQPATARERIERYVDAALANGVERLAFAEHLFRFQEAYDGLYGWWDADPLQTIGFVAARRVDKLPSWQPTTAPRRAPIMPGAKTAVKQWGR